MAQGLRVVPINWEIQSLQINLGVFQPHAKHLQSRLLSIPMSPFFCYS